MKESEFQKKLKDEIQKRFPGCVILKNDPNSIQGFPDLTILFGKLWAVLEVKVSKDASHRPNQNYWVAKMREDGFCRFIYPENKDEVLYEMERYFDES